MLCLRTEGLSFFQISGRLALVRRGPRPTSRSVRRQYRDGAQNLQRYRKQEADTALRLFPNRQVTGATRAPVIDERGTPVTLRAVPLTVDDLTLGLDDALAVLA